MSEKIYVLKDGVRILDNGADEIRLRKGIWNYEEAELDMQGFTEDFKKCFRAVMDALCTEEGFNAENVARYKLDATEEGTVYQVLEQLEAGNYLTDKANRDLNRDISYAILGYAMDGSQGEVNEDTDGKILVISDCKYAKETATQMAATMKVTAEIMSDDLYERLSKADLTTKTDGLHTAENMAAFAEELGKYSVIMACFKNVPAKLMHNLNRVALECRIPVVVAFVDGPMVSILSYKPFDVGCYECFENRSLARIQDHVLYHKFEMGSRARVGEDEAGIIPVINILANLALSESYLYLHFGSSRFEGRLLTIFVPTLEIQVQDVLRVPFCPACGMVAQEQLKEKNISTRALVDSFVNNIIKKELNR